MALLTMTTQSGGPAGGKADQPAFLVINPLWVFTGRLFQATCSRRPVLGDRCEDLGKVSAFLNIHR